MLKHFICRLCLAHYDEISSLMLKSAVLYVVPATRVFRFGWMAPVSAVSTNITQNRCCCADVTFPFFCNNRKRPTQSRKATILTCERKRKRGKCSWGFLALCFVLIDLVLRLWDVVCCMCMCLTVWSRNACTIIGILQFQPHRKHRILVTNTS